jgi:hypothetical protein
MRTTLWITATILLAAVAILVFYLLKSKNTFSLLSSLGIADLTAVISLALNAALFVLTILSLAIAIAAFKASEKSGVEQLETLTRSREALQTTADTLKNSAKDFRDSAEAAKGQYTFLLAEKVEREKTVASALIRELSTNEGSIGHNNTALALELEALKKNSTLVAPINTLETSAWELLRLYLPHEIGTNPKALAGVTDAYNRILYVNEVIRSREEYRLNNQAMDNLSSRMTKYDQTLLDLNNELVPRLKELVSLLSPLSNAGTQQSAIKNP